MNKQVGKRIKDLRQQLGLTQAELADKVGFTSQTVSNWESGLREPDIDALVKLSSLFSVSLDHLLSGKKEDEKITLDDMDAEKRLSWIIKRDDVKNFKKYKYQTSAYVFGRSMGYRNGERLREPIKKTWEEILNENAKKIFGACCDEMIKMNSKKVWAAFLVYDFIDEFVKMAVDCDRPDALETIGFRIFAIGNKPENKRGTIPFMYNQDTLHYVSSVDTYFIKEETFEYIFKNREKSPKCYDYATTLELQIEPLDSYQHRKEYTFTHLHDAIVRYAIKFGYFDTLDKILTTYKTELYSEDLPKNEGNGYESFYARIWASWTNTYIVQNERVIGRVFYFQKEAIDNLIKGGKTEYAKKLNDYNAEVMDRLKKLQYPCGNELEKIPHLSESEFDRAAKLSGELSDQDRIYLLCIDDKILVPAEIKKLRDLKLVRSILNKGFYNYYEFAFDMLTTGKAGELFRFFIDNGLEELANLVLLGKENYGYLLGEIWTLFNLEPGYAEYKKMKHLSSKQNPLSIDNYGAFNFNGESYNASEEAEKLIDNKLIEYIKSLKEAIYTDISRNIDAENKAKQDAADRAKAVKGLTKDYFEGLLSKKGLFAKKEQRLFILDLCSLLDAILKFDYQCEGEDLFERMTAYFKMLQDSAPQSRTMDDGWGYPIEDRQYDEEVVIPEKERIEHLVNIFSRLRIQRNNIAHSESKKVEELNEAEMRECLEYVFSINKEA